MTTSNHVTAFVPAFNEAATVGKTVDRLLQSGYGHVWVIDDGSDDDTALIAQGAGAQVIRLEVNAGKGAALNAGLSAVKQQEGLPDVCLFVDADLQDSAGNLAPLVDAVTNGADVSIADFTTRGGFGTVKTLARSGIRGLTGRDVKSPLSGQRAIKGAALEKIMPFPKGWGIEVYMTVKALWLGLHVIEIPVHVTHTDTGRDVTGFLHRGRQCVDVIKTLSHLALTQHKVVRKT